MRTIILAVASALLLGACSQQSLDVAPNVDLKRFQGQWYEIAKLPRATQADCTGTKAFYALRSDGTMDIVNECHLGTLDGPTRSVHATATVPDASVPAKLSLEFVPGLYGDYWILEVGDHYEYAVVGHPTRQYLWILSRTPTMDPSVLSHVLDKAQSLSFDTSKLDYTAQKTP
jgi:apolipoprotein D and lipocalin family protein